MMKQSPALNSLAGSRLRMIDARAVSLMDDLPELVAEINQAAWDEGNDISEYSVKSLAAYLSRQDTLFVACHHSSNMGRTLLGIASARFEIKPYGLERWLYVDEVDVCANQRRRGAGKAIMRKLIELAAERDCFEVWLGTEVDNTAANALYRSIEPDEVAEFVGYTYELSD